MTAEIQSHSLEYSQEGPSNLVLLPSEMWIQGQQKDRTDVSTLSPGSEGEQTQPRWQIEAVPVDTVEVDSEDSMSAGRPYPVMLIRANPVSDSDEEVEIIPSSAISSDILLDSDVDDGDAGLISPSPGTVSPDLDVLAVHINCKPASLSSLQHPAYETSCESGRLQEGPEEIKIFASQRSDVLSTLDYSSNSQSHSEAAPATSHTAPDQNLAHQPHIVTNVPQTMPSISPQTLDDVSTTSPQATWQTRDGNIFLDLLARSTGRENEVPVDMHSVAEPATITPPRDNSKSEDGLPAPTGFSGEPSPSNKRTICDVNNVQLPPAEFQITKQFCSETRESVFSYQHNCGPRMKLPGWSQPNLTPPFPLDHQNFPIRNAAQEKSSRHPQEIQIQRYNSTSLASTAIKLPSPAGAYYSSGVHACAVSAEENPRSSIPYFSNFAFGHTPKQLVATSVPSSVDSGTNTLVSTHEHFTRLRPHSCISSPAGPKSQEAQCFTPPTSEIPTPFRFPSPRSRFPGRVQSSETSAVHVTPHEYALGGAVVNTHSPGCPAKDIPTSRAVFPFDSTPLPWPSLPHANYKSPAVGPAAVNAPSKVSPLQEPAHSSMRQQFQPSLPYQASVPSAAPDQVSPLLHQSPGDSIGLNPHQPVAPKSRPLSDFFPRSGSMEHSVYPQTSVGFPSKTSVAAPVMSSSTMHSWSSYPSPAKAGTYQKYAPHFPTSTVHWLSAPTSETLRPSSIGAPGGVSRSPHLPLFRNFSPHQSPERWPQISSVRAALPYPDAFRNRGLQHATPHVRQPPPPYHGVRPSSQPIQNLYPHLRTPEMSQVNERDRPSHLKELLAGPSLVNSCTYQSPTVTTYPSTTCNYSSKYIPRAATQENVPPEQVSKPPKHRTRRQNKSSKTHTALAKTSSSQQCASSEHNSVASWVNKFVQMSSDFLSKNSLTSLSPNSYSEKNLAASHQDQNDVAHGLFNSIGNLQQVDQTYKASTANQEYLNPIHSLQHWKQSLTHGRVNDEAHDKPLKDFALPGSSHSTGSLPNVDLRSKASSATPEGLNPPHSLQHWKQSLAHGRAEDDALPGSSHSTGSLLNVDLRCKASSATPEGLNPPHSLQHWKQSLAHGRAEDDALPGSSHSTGSLLNVDLRSKASSATPEGLNPPHSLQHWKQSLAHGRAEDDALPGSSHSTGSLLNVDLRSKASTATPEGLNPLHTTQHFKQSLSLGRADESSLKDLALPGSNSHWTGGLPNVDLRPKALSAIQKHPNPTQTSQDVETFKMHMSSTVGALVGAPTAAQGVPNLVQPSGECSLLPGRAAKEKMSSRVYRCMNCNQDNVHVLCSKLTQSDTEVLVNLNLMFTVDQVWRMSELRMCRPCLVCLRSIGLNQQELNKARDDFKRVCSRDTFLMTWVLHLPRRNFCVHCGGTLLPHPHRTNIFLETSDGWVPLDIIVSELSVFRPLEAKQELYLCKPCFRLLAAIHKALTLMKVDMARFVEMMSPERCLCVLKT